MAARPVVDWLRLIRSEYQEIPGLHLTKAQVQRFWSLDAATCDAVIEALVKMQFLRRTHTGGYILADLAR